eukprot:358902-Amphidinium_carterae.1
MQVHSTLRVAIRCKQDRVVEVPDIEVQEVIKERANKAEHTNHASDLLWKYLKLRGPVGMIQSITRANTVHTITAKMMTGRFKSLECPRTSKFADS